MITFIISRLFSYFFFPPGIFIVILVLAIIFYIRNRHKISLIIVVLSVILIYLFSIEPIKNLLLLPLENYAKRYGLKYEEITSGNRKINGVIVILGGGVIEGSPDLYGYASPSPDAVKRVVYAYLLYKKSGMPIITTGGKRPGLKNSTPEGEVLKNLLIKLGVPSSKIMEENTSINTYQNILRVKHLVLIHQFKNVYIVTSAYHMKRAIWVCKKMNINAIPVPTDYKINRAGYTVESFLPNSLSLYDLRKALHEYIGLMYYRIVF